MSLQKIDINNEGKLSEIQYSKYAWNFTITWISVSVYKGIEFLPQTQIFKSLQQGRLGGGNFATPPPRGEGKI